MWARNRYDRLFSNTRNMSNIRFNMIDDTKLIFGRRNFQNFL